MDSKLRPLAAITIAIFFIFASLQGAAAQEVGYFSVEEEGSRLENGTGQGEMEIHYFWMRGCPYCEDEKQFLDGLKKDYPGLIVHEYRIIPPEDGAGEALYGLAEEHGFEITRIVAPMTVINGELILGYHQGIGNQIRAVVAEHYNKAGVLPGDSDPDGTGGEDDGYVVYLPVVGMIDVSGFSLPLLAFLLGSFDGLNVCSIGALLLVLAIVVKFNSRKKTLFYGGLFLFTTAVVYGLLVFLWYGIMNHLVGYFDGIRLFIGIAALAGGVHFFREFLQFYKYGPMCKTSSGEFINKIQAKVQEKLLGKNVGVVSTITAVVLFAAAITIVELPCSVAIPLVFSAVLVDSGLGPLSFAFYVVMYLFFYLLIELIVFGMAVFTKEIWYGPEKSVTWVTLFASIVMLIIGVYYLYPLLPI